MSNSEADEALRLALKVVQARFGATDPAIWRTLLMFCPEPVVVETAERIKARQHRLARRAV